MSTPESSTASLTARRTQLDALYGHRLTPAQIDAVLADEALFRKMGEAVHPALKDNAELPFLPLFPEGE